MNFTVPSFLSYAMAWAAIVAGLWLIFEKTEETLSPDAKRTLYLWLNGFKIKDRPPSWPYYIILAFDRFFGKEFLSPRFFVASYVASVGFTFTLFLLWAPFHLDQIEALSSAEFFYRNAISAIFLTTTLNVLPDYFSLIETRWVIGRVSKNPSMSQ